MLGRFRVFGALLTLPIIAIGGWLLWPDQRSIETLVYDSMSACLNPHFQTDEGWRTKREWNKLPDFPHRHFNHGAAEWQHKTLPWILADTNYDLNKEPSQMCTIIFDPNVCDAERACKGIRIFKPDDPKVSILSDIARNALQQIKQEHLADGFIPMEDNDLNVATLKKKNAFGRGWVTFISVPGKTRIAAHAINVMRFR